MSKFQLTLTGIFAAFIILGVVTFALYKGSSNGPVANITVWGTLDSVSFLSVLNSTSLANDRTANVSYVQKKEADFDTDLVEALAVGNGPDIFFLSQDSILKHENKIFKIPYKSYSERAFKDTFIQEAELYLTPDGIIGLPITIDPLVMYWNRSIFGNVGVAKPPAYWDEFYDLASKINMKNDASNLSRTAVALGEYKNISHSTAILSALILQAGSPISQKQNGAMESLLGDTMTLTQAPGDAALNFYTQFANPAKPFYSWNRSLPYSVNFFLSGDLATYFGFASEYSGLKVKNPNLDFDIAQLPQSRAGDKGTIMTFGNMQALAVSKSSKNINASIVVAGKLSGAEAIAKISEITGLPPVRRDLLSIKSGDAVQSVFYQSALRARGWLSPGISDTERIFQSMIESITSGRAKTPSQATGNADAELNAVYRKIK